MSIIDIAGKKFNRLTVLHKHDSKMNNEIAWVCKCDCGNIKILRSSKIRNNEIKSCGCYIRELTKSRTKSKSKCWKGYEGISGTLWQRIKYSAKRRKINFSIKIEDAWELLCNQKFKCAISGLDIEISSENVKATGSTASLDRKDSSKGYIDGNIQWVHRQINIMKMDLDEDKFIEFCRIVVNHNAKKE